MEVAHDDALEAQLFGSPASAPVVRPEPNLAMMKKELPKKGMSFMLLWVEHKELHPDGYEYSQFCHLYLGWRRKL
jgi:transposase